MSLTGAFILALCSTSISAQQLHQNRTEENRNKNNPSKKYSIFVKNVLE